MNENIDIAGKYEDIPIGRDNAITRAELAKQWGVSDRLARHMIAKLRAEDNGDGYIIVAFSSRKGYYRTNNAAEILHFKREMGKRARNTFAPMKKVRRVLRESAKHKAEGGRCSGKRDKAHG